MRVFGMITGFFIGVDTGTHSTWTIFMRMFSGDLRIAQIACFPQRRLETTNVKVNRLVG
jgi:hypothetical protein